MHRRISTETRRSLERGRRSSPSPATFSHVGAPSAPVLTVSASAASPSSDFSPSSRPCSAPRLPCASCLMLTCSLSSLSRSPSFFSRPRLLLSQGSSEPKDRDASVLGAASPFVLRCRASRAFSSLSSLPSSLLSLATAASPVPSPLSLQSRRFLYNSHQARVLRRRHVYRDKHLDHVPSDLSRRLEDERERQFLNSLWAGEQQKGAFPPGVMTAHNRVKQEKERFLRECAREQDHLSSLFSEEEKDTLLGAGARRKPSLADDAEEALRDKVEDEDDDRHEEEIGTKKRAETKPDTQLYGRKLQELESYLGSALRTYRILRPDALPFYKEDSLLSMQSKLNEATLKHSPLVHDLQELKKNNVAVPSDILPPDFDALQFSLPVVNPRGFLLALSAAANSVAEDLEALCLRLGVPNLPHPTHPFRLKLLLDALFDSFKLRKDPHYAHDWAQRNWPRLQGIMPAPLSDLSAEHVGQWLKCHLERVCENQRAGCGRRARLLAQRFPLKPDEENLYSLADDFIFDHEIVDEQFCDERLTEFPIDKAGELFQKVADFFGLTKGPEPAVNDGVVAQFQNLVYTLNKIGLSNWLRMDTREIEEFLPEGDPPSFSATEQDLDAARLLLKAAARGKANLLDFEALDPYKLLHGFDAKTVQEELAALPPNPFLTDADIDEIFDVHTAAESMSQSAASSSSASLRNFCAKFGKSPLEALLDSEEKFLASAGPVDWVKGENEDGEAFVSWRWKRPAQTVFDPEKGMFVREREGVDPLIKLHELRQTLLSISRMMSMNKQGRVYYFRAIVAVGNGRGLFGIGIAFGPSPKEARSNAALAAIQNLDHIDFDVGRTLTTPVHGQEYSAHVKIIPRPLGKGLKSNLRYLPLLYLMGIDNCRVKFYGPSASARWFTRAKALKRALEQLQSRRTLANATGQKYDLLVAPGEHWMHWPDRWFRPISTEYARMLERIKKKRPPSYRRGFRAAIDEVIPEEIRPEFTPYTWKSPLQKWCEELKRKRLTSHNIYEKEVFVHPPSRPASAH